MSWRSRGLLAAVCLISGSLWLLPESDTTPALKLCLLTISMVLATVVIGIVVQWRYKISISQHTWTWRLVFSGIGSLSAPALLFLLGRQYLNSVMGVAIQASAPLLVALATGLAGDSVLQPRLGPGLTALAGLLLVFPVALPESSHGWIGFCLYLGATCLSALSSVACHREMVRVPAGRSFLPVAVGNAAFLFLGACVWMTVTSQWHSLTIAVSTPNVVGNVLSAAGLAGVIWLFRLAPPLAVASRFVLAPLLAALEAYVLLRPTLSFRALAGAILILLGGLACLREDTEENSSASTSLH